MEFEDMKLIWDSQNNEPLYAINQEALYRQIQSKSRSITRLLDRKDLKMIVANLLVGILLIVVYWQDNEPGYEYVLPVAYLAFFVYALYRRFARHQEIVGFEKTILGELDKAIWQSEYLIKQSRTMVFWYLLPLLVLFGGIQILRGTWWLALLLIIVLLPLGYFGGQWEVNKHHLPKKRELETLRETLLQAEEQSV